MIGLRLRPRPDSEGKASQRGETGCASMTSPLYERDGLDFRL
jgi:hypothetical protein